MSYFAAKRFQYGTDIIFTYGPLAYLGTGVYSGYLFRERVIWELVFKAINAGVLCWIIAHLPKMWGLVYLAFCLVFVLAEFPEIFYFFSITILVIYLLRGTHGTQLADILAIMVLSAVVPSISRACPVMCEWGLPITVGDLLETAANPWTRKPVPVSRPPLICTVALVAVIVPLTVVVPAVWV